MKTDYSNAQPVIEMHDIVKEFSGVRALTGITFDAYAGEVHCLVGENGAGKSTLMKILSGAYTPTSGRIVVAGQEYKELTPVLAKSLGIDIVYQENDLVQTMNAVENVFIGSEVASGGFVKKKDMIARVRELMERYGIVIDPMQAIENMSVSDQQFVKILKALMKEPKILILDEPTSMFNVEDAGKVLSLVEHISEKGISIIYISHFLKEVRQIADRITVIRDGAVVKTYNNDNKDVSLDDITSDMVGRPVDVFYTKEQAEIGDVMFEVRGLQLAKGSPVIDFSVKRGEILGLSGMVGSGRTEIVRAIAGADRKYAGEVFLNGKKLRIKNPKDGIDAGLAHITEDRQRLGLTLNSSVVENTLLPSLPKIKGSVLYNYKSHTKDIQPLIDDLDIKTPSPLQEVIYLSGGNQQKVVLSKWLFADQMVYIFDEPTRGVDVNAKAEFYKQMTKLVQAGNCIIMVSSDLPELISMSDRVLVIRDGAIECELSGADINEQTIIKEALGVKKND